MRGVSERTVQRHWEKARIYLHRAIRDATSSRDRARRACLATQPGALAGGQSAISTRRSSSAADERDAWLAALRGAGPGARRRRRGAARRAHGARRRRLPRSAAAAPASGGVARRPDVGAYTLVSLIGQGGMGSVWLARRSDGRFEGQVAVKLLNAELVGRAGEERFRREGSILARLTHPHIARLIDAGVSPRGQPYLVLEHVDGRAHRPLLRRARLGVEARLRLFLDVLAAVAHAHAQPDRPPRPQAVERPGRRGRPGRSCSTSASPSCSKARRRGEADGADARGRARR